MIYLLYGANDFAIKEELERIKQEAGSGELTSANTEDLQAKEITPARLLETCNTIPFFLGKRIVIVRDLLSKFDRATGKMSKSVRNTEQQRKELADWRNLVPQLKNISESTILIFTDGKLDKNSSMLKILSPVAQIKSFPPLTINVLLVWIKEQVRKYGGDITPDAGKLLTELTGNNQWSLDNEIRKLVLYCKHRQIDEQDINKLTPLVREANIFSLVDAIIQKRASSAFQYLNELLKLGATHPYILSMIVWRLRLLLHARELLEKDVDNQQASSRLGQSPVATAILLKKAKFYTYKRLMGIYEQVVQTDIAIKSGTWKDDMALQLLIADLCH